MLQQPNSRSGIAPTGQPISSAEFKRRFTRLILLAWVVPPVFGLSFLVWIKLFTPAQIRDIILSPTEATFLLGTLVCAVWYFRRYIEGICNYLQRPGEDQIPDVIRAVRGFPAAFWIVFLVYLALAPTSVMLSAEWFSDYESQPLDWFRVHLVALIVSILVGLPVFYLVFDLFGRALGGISFDKAILTVRTKVLLIGTLIPLLVATLLVQYYWMRTGFFTFETFVVWVALELAAIYGTLVFVRSFGQSLQPFERYVLHEKTASHLDPRLLVPQSTDELGVLAGRFRNVLEKQRALLGHLLHSQKMEAVGRLAGGVAHDINNELFVILGSTDFLRDKTAGGDVESEHIDGIIEAVGRASNLAKSLLTFGRPRAVELKVIRLNEVVANLEYLLQRLVGDDIDMRIELCRDSAVVKVDRGQIEQVLMNLCVNARDAMPDGGSLTIRTEQVLGRAPHAMLQVIGSGVGTDEVTQPIEFEPFFTMKEADQGTGLGLIIAYGIIGEHDGSIDVSSVPGEGTTFTIKLPLTDERVEMVEKVEEKHAPVDSASGATETVLLAEDNDSVLNLLHGYLAREGFDVIIATDGEDAIRKFSQHKDDVKLAVVDIVMPKKNGWQVLAEIRNSNPEAKVLLMSGNSELTLEGRQIDEVDLPLLNKPFSSQEFLGKVRQVLDG